MRSSELSTDDANPDTSLTWALWLTALEKRLIVGAHADWAAENVEREDVTLFVAGDRTTVPHRGSTRPRVWATMALDEGNLAAKNMITVSS